MTFISLARAHMIPLTLEFGGGMELLFKGQKSLKVEVPGPVDGGEVTIQHLLLFIRDTIKPDRPELFLQNETIRPGVLILINENDWELEGGLSAPLKANDSILFISTLHGAQFIKLFWVTKETLLHALRPESLVTRIEEMNCSLSSPLTESVLNTSSPCSSPIAKRCKREALNQANTPAYPSPTDSRITALLQSKDPLMATFQTTMQVGQIIFELWEGNYSTEVQTHFLNKQRFVNYVVGFVMRIGPSVVTLLHGLIYTLRLRSIYPIARGQNGCAHRLFVVAMLVAAKHCRDPRLLIEPDYDDWSDLSGIFEVEELQRMESEFLSFLNGRIYVRLSDLETIISRFFLESKVVDRAVPGSIDFFSLICIERRRLIKNLESKDPDAACPEE